jgi:pyruvate kinase
MGRYVGVLQDLGGPKIRLLDVENPFDLHNGERISFRKDLKVCSRDHLAINHPEILDQLNVGSRIYIADGLIRLEVDKITGDEIKTKVLVGGRISSRKGVNFPNVKLMLNSLTEKDRQDVLFALKNGFDFIAMSFVKTRNDVLALKQFIEDNGGNIPVISKIEKHEAIEDIDNIIDVSDGIMVARGDLGVEIDLEKVPVIQKMIISKANALNKPVITATQMLISMINLPRPTRAEVSDVANAVLDGTDAVMLSDETAVGNFPVEAIGVMVNTILETEKIYPYNKSFIASGNYAIPYAGSTLSKNLGINKIVVFTSTGASAMRTAFFRPEADIIANVTNIEVARKLALMWGIHPNMLQTSSVDIDEMIDNFIIKGVEDGIVQKGEKVVIIMGYPAGVPGSTNLLRVVNI